MFHDGCGLGPVFHLEWMLIEAVAEVKALKSLVRNVIAPDRDLGHTDRALKKNQAEREEKEVGTEKDRGGGQGKECEDCS